jgi:hypothetical protein
MSYGLFITLHCKLKPAEENMSPYQLLFLVTCIKIRRLHWAGHIQRMENTRIPKKALNAKFGGTRTVGRPIGRWEDVVRRDAAGMIQCRNWKRATDDRTTWRQKTEAKARYGL